MDRRGFLKTAAAAGIYAALPKQARAAASRASATNPALSYDIYLSRGQSNDMGRGDLSKAPLVPSGTSIVCETNTTTHVSSLRDLADPFQQTANQPLGQFGSRHTSMANAYMEMTGRYLCIIGGSRGSTGLVAGVDPSFPWSLSPYILLAAQKKKLDAARTLLAGIGAGVNHIFSGWLGGEGDANRGVTRDAWVAAYRSYRQAAQGIFGADYPEFITSIDDTRLAGYTMMADVRQAQVDVCDGVSTFMAVPYQNFRARGLLNKDGLHFSQEALNIVGPMEADAIAAVFP